MDWMLHENSQHPAPPDSWHCSEAIDDGRSCSKVYYSRQTYQQHLKVGHRITDDRYVQRKSCSACVPGAFPPHFWSGFCVEIVKHRKKGLDAWIERFDHIDDHFVGRGLAKRRIAEWILQDVELVMEDENLSDACSYDEYSYR